MPVATHTGIYKREPKSDRPTHILVEGPDGSREPIETSEYEERGIEPHWSDLPWESDFKKLSADPL